MAPLGPTFWCFNNNNYYLTSLTTVVTCEKAVHAFHVFIISDKRPVHVKDSHSSALMTNNIQWKLFQNGKTQKSTCNVIYTIKTFTHKNINKVTYFVRFEHIHNYIYKCTCCSFRMQSECLHFKSVLVLYSWYLHSST